MADYFRPLVQIGPGRPKGAPRLAGGWGWFDAVEHLRRDAPPATRPVSALPSDLFDRLTIPRPPLAGMVLDRPRIMGILNITADRFPDTGSMESPQAAAQLADQVTAQVRAMAADIDLLDIRADSTRPGAATIPPEEEAARLIPVLTALGGDGLPISVDTRRATIAEQAIAAGAAMINDVSALDHDPQMTPTLAASDAALCLMHAPPGPEATPDGADYGDVLLDVYDALAERVARAEAAGIPRHRITVDPGIGFGKTLAHNLALLARISLFHGLGCAVLVGASRKGFVGTIGGAATPKERGPGSLAVALAAAAQGVHILRVHDTSETAQAFRLASALRSGTVPTVPPPA